jgi:formylglycine-generating enzyme
METCMFVFSLLLLFNAASAEEPLRDLGMVLVEVATATAPSGGGERLGRFYIMEAEVTQGLWTEVMGSNPSEFSACGATCPVENVSWYDAVSFANALSRRDGLEECYEFRPQTYTRCKYSECRHRPISPRAPFCPHCGEPRPAEAVPDESKDPEVLWTEKLSCKGYRLPTEAEWEYAASGGEAHAYAGSDTPGDVAWYGQNSGNRPHAVCGKERNAYGLCDMSGNVWEWVWDSWGESPAEGTSNALAPASSQRVRRGGSWNLGSRYARIDLRTLNHPSFRGGYIGFRLSRSAEASGE